jgi:putative membrane protein
MMGFPTWGWWGMGLWMLVVLVFWAGVIALVTWVIVKVVRSGKEQPSSSSQTPLDIVKTRYAKGEINKEEFERLKNDLK